MSKDEVYEDLHTPQPEDSALEDAIQAIRTAYRENVARGSVQPLEAAIFEVWEEVYGSERAEYVVN